MESLFAKRLAITDFYKEHIGFTLEEFEKTILLIE
jgi:hypothetical protein